MASCHTIEAESSVSANDDQTDVERVLAGDISAFEGIVRRWPGAPLDLAYRFCRDRGRAEEMAQEAFLRAYRALGQWRKDAVFSTWLFALATNLYRWEKSPHPDAHVCRSKTFPSLQTRAIPTEASKIKTAM